jgi:hypothetical protein
MAALAVKIMNVQARHLVVFSFRFSVFSVQLKNNWRCIEFSSSLKTEH